MKVRLGTRASALARAQTTLVAGMLADAALERGIELATSTVPLTSEGDTHAEPIASGSASGVFVAALRVALLRGECDAVVHSLKDVPTGEHDELVIAAIPPRADPRDCLVSRGVSFAALPLGAKVGTGSPRRTAQLLALRPDLTIVPMRGNVDTRLARVRDEEVDAVVVAMAGLERLGRADEATEVFHAEDLVPAPGQGALAIELRREASEDLIELVKVLDHAATRAEVTAERAALATVEAGCSAPLGALATTVAGRTALHVRVTNATGTLALNEQASVTGDQAEAAGRAVGLSLIGRGAARLMGAA